MNDRAAGDHGGGGDVQVVVGAGGGRAEVDAAGQVPAAAGGGAGRPRLARTQGTCMEAMQVHRARILHEVSIFLRVSNFCYSHPMYERVESSLVCLFFFLTLWFRNLTVHTSS